MKKKERTKNIKENIKRIENYIIFSWENIFFLYGCVESGTKENNEFIEWVWFAVNTENVERGWWWCELNNKDGD